jgi:hypothetical protein
MFSISIGIFLFGAIVYGTFASGEVQPWAVEVEQHSKRGIKIEII